MNETKKASHADLIKKKKKKGMAWCIKNRCVRVADKHKIFFIMV